MDPDGGDVSGFVVKLANLLSLQKAADDIVAASVQSEKFVLSEETIRTLHGICMEKLIPDAGQYRKIPVHINNSPHVCPGYLEIPALMGTMCRYVQDNWDKKDLIHLSAFCLWRLCWIHPFANGNGRTARVIAYMVMCAKFGHLLTAKNSVVEQIQRNKKRFYTELMKADATYAATQDVDATLHGLEQYMADMLKQQLLANEAGPTAGA